MKKLITAAIIAITFSCSTPEQETTQDCQCYKVYYDYEPIGYQGGTWIWGYVETSRELFSSGGNCQETDYIVISGGNVYKIECR